MDLDLPDVRAKIFSKKLTGARQSEIRTIRVKDVHLDAHYFETGFEKNARKSTLERKKALLFFFPERFTTYLKNYILALGEEEKYLFPSPRSQQVPHYRRHLLHYYVNKLRKK